MVHQEVDQHRGPPHQTRIVFAVGLLQLGVYSFDSRSTDLYAETHGCILLCRCDRHVYGDIHPFAHGRQS